MKLKDAVLNSPQGPQRGLLGLGQSSDARDIEALVGPVAPQRAQSLATLEVPEHNGPVIAATGEPAAIGTHLERLYCPPGGPLAPARTSTGILFSTRRNKSLLGAPVNAICRGVSAQVSFPAERSHDAGRYEVPVCRRPMLLYNDRANKECFLCYCERQDCKDQDE